MRKVVRTIRRPEDLQPLLMLLRGRSKYPYTVNVIDGKERRSLAQNRLQRQWLNDAEAQGDQTSEEYRGFCKLHFGIAILKSESDDFAQDYDENIKPLPYETKLKLMMEPFSLPITSKMSVKGKTKYLDAIWQHFAGLGIQLTDPAMMGIADCWKRCGQ